MAEPQTTTPNSVPPIDLSGGLVPKNTATPPSSAQTSTPTPQVAPVDLSGGLVQKKVSELPDAKTPGTTAPAWEPSPGDPLVRIQTSDGKPWELHQHDLEEAKRRDPKLKVFETYTHQPTGMDNLLDTPKVREIREGSVNAGKFGADVLTGKTAIGLAGKA